MGAVVRYCRRCKRDTRHDVYKEEKGVERAFLAIITLGLNEAMSPTYRECQCCGLKKEV